MALLLGLLTHGRWFAPGTALFMVAGAGPTLAALIITARTEGIAGLKRLLRHLVPAAPTPALYLLALLAFSAIAGAAWCMTPRDVPAFFLLLSSSAFWSILPAQIAVDTGPLGEELGWRGFALPRMLCTSSPWAASILLGVVWTLWHVPAFFLPELPQRHIAFAPFAVNTIALAVIFTWFYLRSGGDLLLMVLLHFLANLVAGAFGLPLWPIAVASTSFALLSSCDPRMRATRPGTTSTQSPLAR